MRQPRPGFTLAAVTSPERPDRDLPTVDRHGRLLDYEGIRAVVAGSKPWDANAPFPTRLRPHARPLTPLPACRVQERRPPVTPAGSTGQRTTSARFPRLRLDLQCNARGCATCPGGADE